MKVYAQSIGAMRLSQVKSSVVDTLVTCLAGFCLANSKQQAMQMTKDLAEKKFPEEDGWTTSCSVVEAIQNPKQS